MLRKLIVPLLLVLACGGVAQAAKPVRDDVPSWQQVSVQSVVVRMPAKTKVVPGIAVVQALGYIDPTVTMSASLRQVKVGDSVVWTIVLAVPSTETGNATGVVLSYTVPAGFTPTALTGPRPITNTATATWGNPPQTASASVTIVVIGATLPATMDASRRITVLCGDMAPGESLTILLTLQYTG